MYFWILLWCLSKDMLALRVTSVFAKTVLADIYFFKFKDTLKSY